MPAVVRLKNTDVKSAGSAPFGKVERTKDLSNHNGDLEKSIAAGEG